MTFPHRGEVWLVDLGMEGKIRPCLVISVTPNDDDRALFTVVPHTTSVRGTRFESARHVRFLRPGAFNTQGLVTVTRPRLMHRLGTLSAAELREVEVTVGVWLGLAES